MITSTEMATVRFSDKVHSVWHLEQDASEVNLKGAEQDHMSILSVPDTQKLITSILIAPESVTAAPPKSAKVLPTTASPELSYVAVRLRAGPVENYVATVNVADRQKRRAGFFASEITMREAPSRRFPAAPSNLLPDTRPSR